DGDGIVSARIPPVRALVDETKARQAAWLGFFGDEDQSIPVEDVEQWRKALDDAPVDHDVVRYSDAGHGFNRDISPVAYRPGAAADAWRRMLDWFEKHLK